MWFRHVSLRSPPVGFASGTATWTGVKLIEMRVSNATRRIATVLAMGALALASAACGEQSASPTATPPSDPLSPPAAGTAVATPISPPRIGATPLVEVTGLFSDPRPTRVDEQRSLGPKPTTFTVGGIGSTMIYDTTSGIQTDLGPGGIGRFSPDSTKMVWVADRQRPFGDGSVMIIDLTSGARRQIATGRLAAFIDNDHVGISSGNSNTGESIDIASSARAPLAGDPFFPSQDIVLTPDGYALRREYLSDNPFPKSRFTLTNPATGAVVLELDAYRAVPAGRGALAVATSPDATASRSRPGYQDGTTNIFLVDIASGRATFVATSSWASPNWPIAASDHYVIWTDGYCGSPQGRSRIFGRQTARIAEIDAALWPSFTPSGLILDGPFGGEALIDPETLDYRAAIPGINSSWSPDYRYASIGQVGGHGGLCG